jgi:hypothetical protein
MAGPITPRALTVLLTCGAILPLAAFLGALPVEGGKKKTLNIISFIVGLIAIAVIGVVLYQYR